MDKEERLEILDKGEGKSEPLAPVPGFESPAAIRGKIRDELAPLAFEVYAKDLVGADENLRHKTAKEVLEFAGINPKGSNTGGGVNINLGTGAIEKMLTGVTDMFSPEELNDVEIEVLDIEETTKQTVLGGNPESEIEVERVEVKSDFTDMWEDE